MSALFHYAYHVRSLEETRDFYTHVLGCTEGRHTDTWVDFDFYGHQLSLHLGTPSPTTNTGKVGNHLVPMPHFGLILSYGDWRKIADRLEGAGVIFDLAPSVRFEGQVGEQWTLFFKDPSGNAIELKGFKDLSQVYAS
ncbi:VOC family protein [Marinomonas posidonica]|uniref:Glyoxalase/bleomycin resistance protein/dioxygenase n=1 Tax=Marinomonas posidonica (strain CECT 7376 / NCIMB 14433 / IVIA-Po-181) TaxID=491952 RepID=F6CTD9_MARPP|nr:VOC family protein [Marinomonas posidonica]AEF53988.1 Glyoxalase/bleomycin resistance protein/dioxygenase [Marinomonas posidonica IVIA-Po-181]